MAWCFSKDIFRCKFYHFRYSLTDSVISLNNVCLWPVSSLTGQTLRNKKSRHLWWLSVLLALIISGCVAGKMFFFFFLGTFK
jgi:hypothetical protein